MLAYEFDRHPPSSPAALRAARPDIAEIVGALLSTSVRSHPPHESAALAHALDGGLEPDEVALILAGRGVAEAFPVRWGESPESYATRTVSEMFVAYLQ
ncbi:hypothetical protein [Methylobacterium sp. J-076]|uniref:hypothetical protein n=1 Tax=Methylobacterium sp. J-076 TaxID=2836655 RepID=UPI001FBB989D|nr:hypothetical protein [Methylobacterium sp. J-076]MCJ2015118.1 hypothetical protein [Methylobacterium sp. J-076]